MRWIGLSLPVAILATSWGCGGATECGEAECADLCAETDTPEEPGKPAKAQPGAGGDLTRFEASVVDPMLEDLRAGIRAWDDEGIGICSGKTRECPEFLGLNPGKLAPGDYHLQAILRVPKAGSEGTWTVTFATECTTTKQTANGSSSSTSNYSKTYTVQYVNEERGARLTPLRSMSSPNSTGEQVCDYTLTMSHPDGNRTIEGQWTVPAA